MSISELLPLPAPPPIPFDPAVMHPAAMLSGAETAYVEEHGHTKPESIHHAALQAVDLKLVKDGYGELVLRVKEGGRFRPVTEEEYAKAYEIFRKYAPGIQGKEPFVKSRIEMMRKEIRQINPNMVGTFIPRTLHDLIFIRKTIEEDIGRAIHSYRDKGLQAYYWSNFWCTGNPQAGELVDEKPIQNPPLCIKTKASVRKELPRLIKIGHRLNEAACDMLNRVDQYADHLSIEQIQKLVNEHTTFLQSFYKQSTSFLDLEGRSYFADHWCPVSFASNFASHGTIYGLAVDHEKVAQFIQKAADLECQPSSIGKIIAYRGTAPHKDYPVILEDHHMKRMAYAMSYGSGLFPGVVNDIGACAYKFIRNRFLGYAFVITPSAESAKYFFAPRLTALESLFGKGELWHYRFKVSQDEKQFIGHCASTEKAKRFQSPHSREELIEIFNDLKKHHAVIFKLGN